ncbi:hypothetical protein UFOVP1419_3 [uncultured Caudovirales phage]|uniref:Uncharacterized protein n=1 Tax=uncultured Caudovirales phage TaxID=2100421 RepID=A0A6J5SDQ1_9CAUD|nr:hypothetical protein UFOVP1419_3 [uncultured Caudovirales phage]
MGQARRRGTFEERRSIAIKRREELDWISRNTYSQPRAELNAILDRASVPPNLFTSPARRGGKSMLLAAMLALSAEGIDRQPAAGKYR